MSRLCWWMVVVLALATFAEAEGRTTQAFLKRALAGGRRARQARTTEAKTETYAVDPSFVARLVVVDPIPQGPEKAAGLRDVDLKQLVVIDTRALIDVTGMPQADAADAISAAGLRVEEITYDYSDTIPAGCVARQDPPAGTSVRAQTGVKLVIAQTKLALHSFPIERGIGGETEAYGQLIVHRLFDVELNKPIQNIPIFAIADKGLRHATVEARAQSVAENLLMAWGILAEGGYLETAPDSWIMPDDEERWRLRGPFAPDYAAFPDSFPAIYVRHEKLGNTPLRVMTVYPEDAMLFGQPADETGAPAVFTDEELAEYLVSLIQAHYLLLAERSGRLEDFEKLEICKTREGRIFKEICLRALEETRETGTSPTSIADLRSALARVALSQRYRLLTLAFNAPRDWRLRNSGR